MLDKIYHVALLAEGVDRNKRFMGENDTGPWSPSSRRAWIEISNHLSPSPGFRVALLAEGVDRNLCPALVRGHRHKVALLAEGVDRNLTYHRKKSAQKKSPSSRRAWIEI